MGNSKPLKSYCYFPWAFLTPPCYFSLTISTAVCTKNHNLSEVSAVSISSVVILQIQSFLCFIFRSRESEASQALQVLRYVLLSYVSSNDFIIMS